jgi:sterol desaturase/sphingolipid hydroxylase (fatty acid hydroxylase superfamily)
MISPRVAIFITAFAFFTIVEAFFSARELKLPWTRKIINLSMPMIGNFLSRVLLMALVIQTPNFSFNLSKYFELDGITHIIFFVIIMDLIVYIQHVLTHKVPILWRLHRVHHSDTEMDASTGFRFHPFELIFSTLLKYFFYRAVGFSLISVFWFEAILSTSAMFNHMRVMLPKGLDRFLSIFIVTPNMHLNHHLVPRNLTDSNYGFFLAIWDRIFRTYTKPLETKEDIGLPKFREKSEQRFIKLMIQPFK